MLGFFKAGKLPRLTAWRLPLTLEPVEPKGNVVSVEGFARITSVAHENGSVERIPTTSDNICHMKSHGGKASERPSQPPESHGIQTSYLRGVSLKASGNSTINGPFRSRHLRSVLTATASNVGSPELFKTFTSPTFPSLPTCSS